MWQLKTFIGDFVHFIFTSAVCSFGYITEFSELVKTVHQKTLNGVSFPNKNI